MATLRSSSHLHLTAHTSFIISLIHTLTINMAPFRRAKHQHDERSSANTETNEIYPRLDVGSHYPDVSNY